jgi:hypothetical protein
MQHEEVPWYISLIISWLPFLFMLAVWYWITRTIKLSLKTPDGRSVGQVIADVGAELKASNERLDKILSAYGARLDALEKPH